MTSLVILPAIYFQSDNSKSGHDKGKTKDGEWISVAREGGSAGFITSNVPPYTASVPRSTET